MSERFNPVDHPTCTVLPDRLTNVDDFHPHLPVAMALVSMLRPSRVVELGVYLGDSLCSMAQAVRLLALPTKLYGVDTWKGDEHSGRYGEEIVQDLRRYLVRNDYQNVELIRKTTLQAVPHFRDGSVDLLHIDADHTYEGVKADWEGYLPKVSEQGAVILHDIYTFTHPQLKVWKLWEEIKAAHPGRTFEFPHAWGVGLVQPNRVHPNLVDLFAMGQEDVEKTQQFFAVLGQRVMDYGEARRQAVEALTQALKK